MQTVWEMQVKAFSDLLEKYQDYDISPAAESFEKVMARFQQFWTTYYFITADGEPVGGILLSAVSAARRDAIRNYFPLPKGGTAMFC